MEYQSDIEDPEKEKPLTMCSIVYNIIYPHHLYIHTMYYVKLECTSTIQQF
jgi:hypothetical protein